MNPCWGYHYSSIPAESVRLVDGQGREWLRAGPRSWQRLPRQLEQSPRMHEAWLLEHHGPVRCASTEDLLERRDAKLMARLQGSAEVPWLVYLPGAVGDGEPVEFEDAMMLMRAGWLAWSSKQRREALESLRQTEMDEVAKTS
jgi:hypothetical protein